jgi:hypothetical protein
LSHTPISKTRGPVVIPKAVADRLVQQNLRLRTFEIVDHALRIGHEADTGRVVHQQWDVAGEYVVGVEIVDREVVNLGDCLACDRGGNGEVTVARIAQEVPLRRSLASTGTHKINTAHEQGPHAKTSSLASRDVDRVGRVGLEPTSRLGPWNTGHVDVHGRKVYEQPVMTMTSADAAD